MNFGCQNDEVDERKFTKTHISYRQRRGVPKRRQINLHTDLTGTLKKTSRHRRDEILFSPTRAKTLLRPKKTDPFGQC